MKLENSKKKLELESVQKELKMVEIMLMNIQRSKKVRIQQRKYQLREQKRMEEERYQQERVKEQEVQKEAHRQYLAYLAKRSIRKVPQFPEEIEDEGDNEIMFFEYQGDEHKFIRRDTVDDKIIGFDRPETIEEAKDEAEEMSLLKRTEEEAKLRQEFWNENHDKKNSEDEKDTSKNKRKRHCTKDHQNPDENIKHRDSKNKNKSKDKHKELSYEKRQKDRNPVVTKRQGLNKKTAAMNKDLEYDNTLVITILTQYI